jgi:uncharacterized protein (TIGR02391 family)
MPKTKKRAKKKIARKSTRPKKKQLSAVAIQNLRTLAEQIGNIIPATSFHKGAFCFQTIAKKQGLQKEWPALGSKKERIFPFLRAVYRSHPKMFYKIFRENIAQGIERRHKSGDPVLQAEILQLDATLKKLNVNLSKEFKDLHLPAERPSIVPPPFGFQKMLDELGLHPYLLPDCPKLFKGGHINESVRKALEKYETYVQQKSALTRIGTDLMANAFNETTPLVKVADAATDRGKGLQMGFKFVSMGAMSFWRNLCAHGDEDQMPHQDAIAILATTSHLLHYIDSHSK